MEDVTNQSNKNNRIVVGRFFTDRGLFLVLLISLPIIFYLADAVTAETKYSTSLAANFKASASPTLMNTVLVSNVQHLKTPDFVKGIYISAMTASSKQRMRELVDLIDRTELNSMVIDVKDGRGRLAFLPRSSELKKYTTQSSLLGSLRDFTAPMKAKNIYLIARIFVFQDPAFAEAHPEWSVVRSDKQLWRDYRGVPWLDPASKNVWRYNVAVAREAFAGGFDEVQFDYIRFPSDGNLQSMVYSVWNKQKSKADVMDDFFAFLDRELRQQGIPISVDLFGLTMWQHDFDMNIGQKLSTALPHFNFISPMVYPSHYPNGFDGYPNPATEPYNVVYKNMLRGDELRQSMLAAVPKPTAQLATFRPWLQDFDLGATYTPEMVRVQMQAAVDGGASGWLIWNARNVYTTEALGPKSS